MPLAIGSDEVDLDALQVCLDEHDNKKKGCYNEDEDEDSTIAAAVADEEAKLLLRQQEEQNISFSTRRSAFSNNINLQMHPLSPL